MSGKYARFGQQVRMGAELAIMDINFSGGVLGKKIKLLVRDDGCQLNRAREAAGLMASSRVVFVSGHFCPETSLAAARIYEREKILQVNPAPPSPGSKMISGPLALFWRSHGGSIKSSPFALRLASAGIRPDFYLFASYSAIQAWRQAAKKAGTVDPGKISNLFLSGMKFDTVLGPISFRRFRSGDLPGFLIMDENPTRAATLD
jgi:ABC-type branched-subunit amino acid transport system substrate-binding protein